MKNKKSMTAALAAFLLVGATGTAGAASANQGWTADARNIGTGKIQVILSEIPYPTEKYVRIGYTLKTWEFEKDNLKLQKVLVLDGQSGAELLVMEGPDLPAYYRNADIGGALIPMDRLFNYYLSIQLPISLHQTLPKSLFHRLYFNDTKKKQTVMVEGGAFAPRADGAPIVIASPVRGRNLVFINQSTSAYHFNALFFMNRTFYCEERFALDTAQFNDDLNTFYHPDPAAPERWPTNNEAYFNYGQPLYAVAAGVVIAVRDGLPENHGSLRDAPMTSFEDNMGNYVALDLGGGRYAKYMHCVPGSFNVKVGDSVAEGDVLATLGNSGSSDCPHLHFQISDSPDPITSRGLPFVLKEYTKTGEFPGVPLWFPNGQRQEPQRIQNSMMEQTTAFDMQ